MNKEKLYKTICMNAEVAVEHKFYTACEKVRKDAVLREIKVLGVSLEDWFLPVPCSSEGHPLGGATTLKKRMIDEYIDAELNSRIADIELFDELKNNLKEIRDERSKRNN